MSKVLRHLPFRPDELLGRVEPDGRAYETRFGPDKYIGWVDLETGKVYAARFGLDKYVGRVDLKTGKVYRHRPLASDEYLGRVAEDGRLFRHRPLAPDEYLGSVEAMRSAAHGGAAFLLLVWPAVESVLDTEGEQDTE